MTWYPPDDYKPIRGVSAYLFRMDPPKPGSAEDLLVRMAAHFKSPQDVGLTREMARALIDRRLVPITHYPAVLAIAFERDS